jgi:hypothetical protein
VLRINKRLIKRIITVFIIVIAILGGIAFWFTAHYRSIINKKLPILIAAYTDSVYSISYRKLNINIFTRSITVRDLKLRYDTVQIRKLNERGQASKTYISLNVPELEIYNISWTKFIEKKEFKCEQIFMDDAKIFIFHTPWLSDTFRHKTRLLKTKGIYAERIKIVNANIIYSDLGDKNRLTIRSNNSNIRLNNWEYKPEQKQDAHSFILAKNGTIFFKNISYETRQSLYAVSAEGLYFSSAHDSLHISGLKIAPSVDTTTFYIKKGKQTDMLNAFFPSISLSGIEWQRLFADQALVVKAIGIDNAIVSNYFSRLAPLNTDSKYGKSPPQLLQKMKIPVFIQTVTVNNGTVAYTELNNITKKNAAISFHNIRGSFHNVTNIPAYLTLNRNCVINIQGKFMGRSDMAATINFRLGDTTGAFSISSYMTDLDASEISKQTQALALVNIKALYSPRLDFTMQGNEYYAAARVSIQYDKLKIKLQGFSHDSMRIKNKAFPSFIVNHALIYPANPMPNEAIRTVNTYTKRNEYRSFFNLVWKNILQGVLKTIARSDEAARMMELQANVAPKPKKEKNKKGLLKLLFGKKNKDQ